MLIQKNYKAHANIGHPENFTRVEKIVKEFPNAPLVESFPCEKHISKIHPKRYIEKIKTLSKEKNFVSGDNSFFEDTYSAAIGAVATAIKAVDENTFAAIRPPGHHAYTERFEGFCYFNNIAIAVKYAQSKGYKRIAIIDIDAHYGDGTHWIFKSESEIFYSSVHANPPYYYPGVKYRSDNSFLVDVEPRNIDDKEMVKILRNMIKKVKNFKPSFIAVSAGFDTYYNDALMNYRIHDISTYEKIGKLIRQLDVPTFSLLEGGYSDDLGLLVKAFYKGLYE